VKGRTAKSETPNPKEIRRPKVEGQRGCGARFASAFGFRVSSFLRISDFGFRAFSLALFLLAAQPCFAATTTNTSAQGEIPALRPPHAEIPPTFWEQHGAGVVVGVGLLLVLACVAIWFLSRPKPPVVVPPEVQARQELELLGQRPEDGALLSQVSHILRHYLSAAFNLPAVELTTTEFCRTIAGHEQVGPDLSVALTEFLLQCDQRKFSPPTPAPPLGVVTRALKLIDQAQARRPPTAP
jgi:hypothetical protein